MILYYYPIRQLSIATLVSTSEFGQLVVAKCIPYSQNISIWKVFVSWGYHENFNILRQITIENGYNSVINIATFLNLKNVSLEIFRVYRNTVLYTHHKILICFM